MKWKYIIFLMLGIVLIIIGITLFYHPLNTSIQSLGVKMFSYLSEYTISENTVSLGNLVNVTAETNFTHLNISTTAPYDSLVGYWSFDGDKENTQLTTHYDWSKYNKDGTGHQNETYGVVVVNNTNCIYGDCLQTNGFRANYVNTSAITVTDYMTISAWIRPTNVVGTKMFISMYSGNTANFLNINLNANQVSANGAGSDAYARKSVSTVSANQWTHVVVIKKVDSGFGNISDIYINGVNSTQPATYLSRGTINTVNIGAAIEQNGRYPFNGSIDEVMIFNTSLTDAQILAIYNNQSSRFAVSGTQEIYNQTYMNITSGNNRVNVTTYIENNLGSSINLSVGYYAGSWSYTTPQVVTSGAVQTFTISSTSTNLTLNYTFYAGNSTNPFYSPIIKENITFEAWNEAEVGDTIYPNFSGYWDNNATLIDTGIGLFNVTVENTNGTVILHINNTDIFAQNITSNVYNASWNFTSSGTYLYNWTAYGNGTSNNLNTSINRYYTVNSSVADTCTCQLNTNWIVDLSDYCIISAPCEIGSGNLSFIGTGNFTCNSNINISNLNNSGLGANDIMWVRSGCTMYIGGS